MNLNYLLLSNESVIPYDSKLSPVITRISSAALTDATATVATLTSATLTSATLTSATLTKCTRPPSHTNTTGTEFFTFADIPIIHKARMQCVCDELCTVISDKDETEIMEECMECFHTIPSSKAIYNTVFYERYAYCSNYCCYDHERELRKEYRRQQARNRTRAK